jgi:hypothetical protein
MTPVVSYNFTWKSKDIVRIWLLDVADVHGRMFVHWMTQTRFGADAEGLHAHFRIRRRPPGDRVRTAPTVRACAVDDAKLYVVADARRRRRFRPNRSWTRPITFVQPPPAAVPPNGKSKPIGTLL